jgi:predicted nucleotidyltransferase
MRVLKSNIISFLQEIKAELRSDGIVALGLFGSFARDEAGVYSDIDIAIQKEKNYLTHRTAYEYFDEITKIKTLIKKKFHRNSDIFDLDSNSSMRDEIMKDIIYV